jgi:outer membrane receptor protein involved in Fe transport
MHFPGRAIPRGITLAMGAAMFWSIASQGQQAAGEIHLEVKDPSGAPMQASTKLVNLATGAEQRAESDLPTGVVFSNLVSGRYRLEVSKAGFNTQALRIDVAAGSSVSRTVTMAVGALASRVDVVATTPLPGVELAREEIPAPVQTATAADLEQSGATDLSDFMNRRLNGVYLNEMQGNPFQPDVNYRGYTASPLLGTPQGISVYLDGVRQNQPFGDVVSWDLIPRNAIAEVTVMPGSNPVFGLNTLGGALSVQTKDGLAYPGFGGQLVYGSSGRKSLEAQAGGGKPVGFNWFLSANAFHESGWRVDSPSDVRQGFGKFGWRTDKTDFALTAAFVYNTLTGNGLQDYRLLAANYNSVYTIPDTTGDRSPSFNFRAQHTFSDALTFSGNVWYRNIRTEGINGNLNSDSLDQSVYQPSAADQAALQAAGYTGYPTNGANAANTPFPFWSCIAQGLQLAEPDKTCDAVTVYSKTVQQDYGLSGQVTSRGSLKGHRNQVTTGAVFNRATDVFTQNTQFGYLNPNRTITGIPVLEDGSTTADGVPVDSRVNLHGVTPNVSFFATDTLSISKEWSVTASARYNRNTIDNTDRINPITGPGSLNGDYVFQRVNPSIGVTYNPTSILNAYANYAQGSRAPTSIELGCADPLNPCSLPNALASDPPLKQVVTNTWEAGLRGKLERNISWNAGGFRAENTNDILFVSSVQTGSGYFKNFARTQRQGIQADVDGRLGRASFGVDYTFLDATYQSTETVNGNANNTSDSALAGFPGVGGNIVIHPGNRIPLIPKQTGKVFVDVKATSKLMLNLGLVTSSSSYARGNENNAYCADGKYYLGPGVSPGYAVVNLGARYSLTRHVELVARIDNLLDRHYYTAAQLANTGFTPQGTFLARPFAENANGDFPLQSVTFFAPGAPRRAWVELHLKF